MKISSTELNKVSTTAGERNNEPKSLEELFSEPGKSSASSEAMRTYIEGECQKEIKRFLEDEHKMSMRERQASVNTSHAITGVIAAWGLIGITMLARSCINFDKGDKFKV